MFYNDGVLVRSDILNFPGVSHAFSTRLGGVSTNPHTREMNIALGHGDEQSTVIRNTEILVSKATDGRLGAANAVVAPQIHSAKVRVLTQDNAGEGVLFEPDESCDGFVTDSKGVVPIVRTADCVPILMCGTKKDGSPVVAAVHAGWRGTAAGIAAAAVEKMCSLGAEIHTIRAAIGPHIDFCCFEVGEDLLSAVTELRGADFVARHVRNTGTLHADLTGMNKEILVSAGVREENVDASDECTFCNSEKYHSHRKTGGKRGAMGSLITIL